MTFEGEEVNERLFECDCHGREHIIIAYHSSDKDCDEIYLNFQVHWRDSRADSWVSYKHKWYKRSYRHLKNWFRRKWWRIKTAIKILFFGWVDLEDSWIPARMGFDNKDGIAFGYTELQAFIGWLSDALETSKRNDSKRIAVWKKERSKKK